MRRARISLAVALVAMGVALVTPARADVLTNGGNVLRTGWYDDQPAIGPTDVSSADFGQLWSANVTGQVYAQPLVSQGTVLVATESNDIFGLDEQSGAQIWSRHLHVPWDPTEVNCADLTPTIGITGTPVIDAATNTAYFLAKTYVTGSTGPAAWYMHAVNVATGAERAGFPVLIQGNATNAPAQAFDATRQMQRPGLLLMDGVVYVGFGGHCTSFPYQGWVVGVSEAGQIRTMWATTDQSTGQFAAGIWGSGGGLVSDRDGSIVFATGNGTPPQTPAAGDNPPATGLGVSVVRLTVQGDGSLQPTDFFSPHNAQALSDGDVDLGSGAPVALPPSSFGTPAHPNLIVEVGKEGAVWLLDADHLGGFQQGPGGSDDVLGRVGPDGGVWSKPTPWGGDGGWVYITTAAPGAANTGSSGFLHAYHYGLDGGGVPSLSLTGTSSDGFGFGSGTPVVTSDGTTSGSAVVWTVWMANAGSTNAELRAYDPVPVGGVMQLRRSFPIGWATKFSAPTVTDGRLFLGTRDGHVRSFGRQVSSALTASAVAFGNTTVGQNAVRNATFTAQQPVTVTGASNTGAAFSLGTPTPAFGTPLAAGATITIPVTFTPSAVGPASGVLTLTSAGGISTTGLSGTGLAAAPLLTVDPSSIDFGGIPVGTTSSSTVTIANQGAQPLQITGTTGPAPPFSAQGIPANGTTIASGGSLAITLRFSPNAAGAASGALDIASTGGPVHVALNGTAGTAGHLSVGPPTLSFPATPTGGWAELSFTVSNTGDTALTITRSKPPVTGGFVALTDLPEGTTLAAGTALVERVRFAPTVVGAASSTWSLNGDGTSTLTDVALNGTGVANSGIPSPVGGGWSVNGAATVQNGQLVLTPPNTGPVAGSAIWPTPIDPSHVRATFDLTIDSGTGADGAAFAILPTSTDPHSVGSYGGGLGWAGLGGVAVGFDTHQNPGEPSSNFVGVTTSSTNGTAVYSATSTAIGGLRNATHHVVIATGGGHITISVDGTQVLDRAVTLPGSARVAFSASTGGFTDRHALANIAFALPTTATQAFVLAGYHDFLNRSPTPAELAAATAAINGGTLTRAAFVQQLATSAEWVQTIVDQLYRNTLGRPADPGGLAFWSGRIRSGARTVAQVAAELYGSPEYYAGLGGGTDASWVTDLYTKILGRPPDAAGRAYWVSRIPIDGRVGVAYPFFQSPESAHARVRALYLQLLGREPDAGGWDYWAARVVTDGDITLAVNLASSAEYDQHAIALYGF